jgi:hypothetical protein
MRRAVLALAALLLCSGAAPAAERRCGWLLNPTPANWSLRDRDGEWLLSSQGGYEAAGMEAMPDMSGAGWVVTNGASHGHGCACLTVEADPKARRVLRLLAAQPLPLARCRADRSLPPP